MRPPSPEFGQFASTRERLVLAILRWWQKCKWAKTGDNNPQRDVTGELLTIGRKSWHLWFLLDNLSAADTDELGLLNNDDAVCYSRQGGGRFSQELVRSRAKFLPRKPIWARLYAAPLRKRVK